MKLTKIIPSIVEVHLRVWLGIVFWCGSFATYILRVEQPHLYSSLSQSNYTPICTDISSPASGLSNPMREESATIQKLLRNAYSIGYVPTALLSGWVIEWYGARYTTGISMLIGSVCNILIPVMAGVHWFFPFTLQFAIGITGAIYFPALQHLIAQWSPVGERGRFYSTITASSIAFFSIHNFVNGVSTYFGWKVYYYATSTFAFITAGFWIWLIEENPEDSIRITEKERNELLEATASFIDRRRVIPPYMKLLSNVSFWALLVAHMGFVAGLTNYSSVIVAYFTTMLGYQSDNYTLAISFSSVLRFSSSVFFGWLSDFSRKKRFASLRTIRNLHVLCTACLYGIVTLRCHPFTILSLMMVYGFLNGAMVGGHIQNSMDLSPNFVATIYGIMQFTSHSFGLLMKSMKTEITKNRYVETEWHNFIKIWSITYAVSGVFFMVFGAISIDGLNTKVSKSQKLNRSFRDTITQALLDRRVATL